MKKTKKGIRARVPKSDEQIILSNIHKVVTDKSGHPSYRKYLDKVIRDTTGCVDIATTLLSSDTPLQDIRELMEDVDCSGIMEQLLTDDGTMMLHSLVRVAYDASQITLRPKSRISSGDIKSYRYLCELYSKSIKKLRKTTNVKGPKKKYKDKYADLARMVKKDKKHYTPTYDFDSDYYDDLPLTDEIDDDEDDDTMLSMQELLTLDADGNAHLIHEGDLEEEDEEPEEEDQENMVTFSPEDIIPGFNSSDMFFDQNAVLATTPSSNQITKTLQSMQESIDRLDKYYEDLRTFTIKGTNKTIRMEPDPPKYPSVEEMLNAWTKGVQDPTDITPYHGTPDYLNVPPLIESVTPIVSAPSEVETFEDPEAPVIDLEPLPAEPETSQTVTVDTSDPESLKNASTEQLIEVFNQATPTDTQ